MADHLQRLHEAMQNMRSFTENTERLLAELHTTRADVNAYHDALNAASMAAVTVMDDLEHACQMLEAEATTVVR